MLRQRQKTPLHAAIAAPPKFAKELVELLLCECTLNLNVEAKPSSRAQKILQENSELEKIHNVDISRGLKEAPEEECDV